MPAISREPSRNFSVSSSPANLMVITVPSRGVGDRRRRLADPRLAQQVGELTDAGLLLALLVLGGVVAAVLLEVALLAAGVDLRGHRRAAGHQLVELGLQPVVGFLGQPDALVLLVSGGGHVGVLLRLGWPAPERGPAVVDPAKLTPGSAADARMRAPCRRRPEMRNRTGPCGDRAAHFPRPGGRAAPSAGRRPGRPPAPRAPGDNGRVTEPDQLRLLAVHAHPDDESSKGAATMAKYVAEGARVLVATCTGGERGSVLNPAMDRPEVWERLPQIRVEEMDRAREILGVEQEFLGFVDSGLPEGDPLPPLPEGCFAARPDRGGRRAARGADPPLQAAGDHHLRRARRLPAPRPHQDPRDLGARLRGGRRSRTGIPELGEPWQPSKLYYHMSFTLPRTKALHEAILATGAESPVHRVAGQLGPGARHLPPGHHAGAVRRVLRRSATPR